MYFYFLTIDKVRLSGAPTKQELLLICKEICIDFNLTQVSPYPLCCFEWKNKGRKHGKYLHYHCMLQSSDKYINYYNIKKSGYSLKLEKLFYQIDIVRVAGYMVKLKVDRCNLIYKINTSN